jgi:hypothetical protein
LLHLALVAPETREAHCGAEFPGFGLLLRHWEISARRACLPSASVGRLFDGFHFGHVLLAFSCTPQQSAKLPPEKSLTAAPTSGLF